MKKYVILLLAALTATVAPQMFAKTSSDTQIKKVQVKKVKKCKKHKKAKKITIFKVTEKSAITPDSEKVITVNHKRYKKIRIELPRALVSMGNITAWKLANQSGPLGEVKYKYIEPDGKLMGSAGRDKFTFKITGKGKAALEFGHELQTPDGTPLNERLEPPSIYFAFDIK